ncbi:glycosyltransferase family 9 protein [Spirosoma flavum]|uniref:Glycosyltransferase family 9 protein n=1 Tax=Spirosoma flavum TaxID=2048557 RepID=A0ABW6AUP7_9BACT
MNLNSLIKVLKRSPILQGVLVLADAGLWFIDTLVILTTRRPKALVPTLLVLKFDQIGDYVAWRNYLRVLLQHPIYKGYRIVLCGSSSFRQLAEHFDSDVIHQFIWVDIYKLVTRPLYRLQLARQLRQLGATVSINPTYSRVLVLDDYLTRVTDAAVRIGCATDFTNTKRWEAWLGNQYFTQLLPTGTDIVFEVERYRCIFSAIIGTELSPQLPHFPVDGLPAVELPPRYAIVAPGASAIEKIWPMANFAGVITQLQLTHSFNWIVTGTQAEHHFYQQLRQLLPSHILLTDTTGQLSLPQLLQAVSGAVFVLSNDSGTAHLAAAFHTPCVAVSHGLALGRWSPYPEAYGLPIRHVYPPYINQHLTNIDAIAPDFQKQSPLSIRDVRVEDVLAATEMLLRDPVAKPLTD